MEEKKNMKPLSMRRLTLAALIAAVYAVVTILTASFAYGPIQFRIAEALCILPFFLPFTTWGLFVGCILANIISPVGVMDMIFGSLATLGCCLCAAAIGKGWDGKSWGKCILACLMPVVWNAVIIGLLLAFFYAEDDRAKLTLFFLYGAEVGMGELAVMFVLGLPLMRWLPNSRIFQLLKSKLDKAG